jgi:uncharacterized protein (DUF2345 family)
MHSGQAIGMLAGAVAPGEGNAGIKLYAGQGDVELQAQSDEMTFAAKELVRLISANSHVDFAAAKSITLATAGGASLTIEGGNITFACPGTISIKAASKSFTGPTNLAYEMNKWPQPTSFDEDLVLRWPYDQTPVSNRKFEIVRGDGSVVRGVTDSQGKTGLQKSQFMESISFRLLPE